MQKTSAALNLIAVIALIFVLRAGSFIFVPFVVALFLWVLIWMLDTAIEREVVDRFKLPRFVLRFSSLFSIVLIGWIAWLVISAFTSQVPAISTAFLAYRETLPATTERIKEFIGIDILPFADSVLPSEAGVKRIFSLMLHSSAGIVQFVGMVAIFLLFMLMERVSLEKKLPIIFGSAVKMKTDAGRLLQKILSKVRAYMLLKSLISMTTATLSYLLMLYVGLEFAGVWAILIGVMNFVPTLGVIISSVVPIVFSTLQFGGEPAPILTMIIGIAVIQATFGQFIEPLVMSKNVNISPLVQIVSMVVWGWIWGPVGMFLCIPIMIILSIVLYNIPSTKRIAILISEDGETI